MVAVAGVVALLAGCGSEAGLAAAAHPTPQQRAAGDAARLLASFIPPPQAVRVTRSPVALLDHTPSEAATVVEQIRAGWWLMTDPPDLLAWLEAHPPAGSSYVGGGGYSSSPGSSNPALTFLGFSLPDVPGLLADRMVVVAIVADGPDRTAIGVYGESLGLPARTGEPAAGSGR